MRHHSGRSLIEILIVIAILSIVVGLVIAAVQKARGAAARAISLNNLRQMTLGVHQLASVEGSKVKGLTKTNLPGPLPNQKVRVYKEQSIFSLVIPYVHGPRGILPPNPTPEQITEYTYPIIKSFIDPADPTLLSHKYISQERTKITYTCNMIAFDQIVDFPVSIPDGTSNTLAFTQHYFYCHSRNDENLSYFEIAGYNTFPPAERGALRRATFADRGCFDVVPEPAGQNMTRASVPGKTFQYMPLVDETDPKIPSTPHPGGLPVALFDGSVRTLSPGIAESVFWGLVTPNGGETVEVP